MVSFQLISGEHSVNLGKYFVGLCNRVGITSEKCSKVHCKAMLDKIVDNSYSCGQSKLTNLISCDRAILTTNYLQIQIQLIKICQKTYLQSFPHGFSGTPIFLVISGNIMYLFWGSTE